MDTGLIIRVTDRSDVVTATNPAAGSGASGGCTDVMPAAGSGASGGCTDVLVDAV